MRSISALFSEIRFSTEESICESGTGLSAAPGTETAAVEVFFPTATVSSTIVFHSPHAGHLPIHLELSLPHDLQNHTVFVFTVAIRLDSFILTKITFFLQNDNKKKILFLKGQYLHRAAGTAV
jgi:hypothetical protein